MNDNVPTGYIDEIEDETYECIGCGDEYTLLVLDNNLRCPHCGEDFRKDY